VLVRTLGGWAHWWRCQRWKACARTGWEPHSRSLTTVHHPSRWEAAELPFLAETRMMLWKRSGHWTWWPLGAMSESSSEWDASKALKAKHGPNPARAIGSDCLDQVKHVLHVKYLHDSACKMRRKACMARGSWASPFTLDYVWWLICTTYVTAVAILLAFGMMSAVMQPVSYNTYCWQYVLKSLLWLQMTGILGADT